MSPAWTEHVMWWHTYPLGFVGAPVRPERRAGEVEHRLPMFEGWLEHILELGLNGLALGPIFACTSHGYDTVDHYAIDNRLGDEEDFTHLVAAAKEKGIRILLDGVFNHVGREHPWFADVEGRGPDSPHAEAFRIDWSGWTPGDPVKAEVFEGHDALVTLNHESPTVVDHVVDVMSHWLARGADGWRLDAAYAVPPEFWAKVLPQVRERHPDAWFSGEVIHGADIALVERSTMDSLTEYELWQGIWHAISDGNLYELSHAIDRHNELLPGYIASTFVGNHDVTRIASAIGPGRVGHALAVLFTVAGVPFVYAGDEYGWLGVKEERLGGDDAVRPTFPAEPPRPDSLDPAAAQILQQHQQLIALRRRNPWLHHAHSDIVSVSNESLVFRTATATAGLVTVLNLSADEVRVPRQQAGASVAAGEATADGTDFVIPPHAWAILSESPSDED